MTEKRSFDAVFVGGGVIGLACAWRAAQRGARVAVLERAEPPAGATRVAAGMLAPVGELTFGEPRAAGADPGLGRSSTRSSSPSSRRRAGRATGYARQGALHVALDRDEAAELRRVHDLQRSLGLEAEWLPPRRCRELEPGLTPSFNGGVHAPGEAAVDPRALTRGAAGGAAPRPGRRCGPGPRSSPASSRASAWPACGPPPARSCAPTRSCSPPAPGRARPSGCPSTPARRCARSRARSLELRSRDGAAALRADRRLRARLPGAAPRRPPDRRRHRPRSRASTPRSPPAASTSCCARPTACSPTSPRWSWSTRSPACAPAPPTTCR